MNSFQRYFYRRTPEYKKKLEDNFVLVNKIVDARVSLMWREEHDRQKRRDDKCPRCGETEIVNKIAQVKGSVSGNFSLGYGSVYGSTDTKEVNHCNACGNQWKKYKLSSVNQKEAIKDMNRDMTSSMKPEYYDTYKKIFEELKDVYAESIDIIFRNNVSDYISRPTLSWLKTKFKSIYDK